MFGQLKTFRMIVNIFYANVYYVRQKDKFISSTQKASRDRFNQLSLGLFYTVFFPPPPKLKEKKNAPQPPKSLTGVIQIGC